MSGLDESTGFSSEPNEEKLSNNYIENPFRWQTWASLSSLIMALLAASGALLSAITANSLILEKIKEFNDTSRWKVEILSVELLKAKHDILIALGKDLDATEVNKLNNHELKSRELKTKVYREKTNILQTAHTHEVFSLGGTLPSVASGGLR